MEYYTAPVSLLDSEGIYSDHGETFAERVRSVPASLEPGRVVSDGDVTDEAGRSGAARNVGRVLASDTGDLPWWRVVYGGRLAPCDPGEQRRRPAAEGVTVDGVRVRPSPRRRDR